MWCKFEQVKTEETTITNKFTSQSLFRIKSDDSPDVHPKVQAYIQNDCFLISIDKDIAFVRNEKTPQCVFVSGNAEVDVMIFANSGKLIICGLRNGEIHLISFEDDQVHDLVIEKDDLALDGVTFTSIHQHDNRFVFICSTGSIYVSNELIGNNGNLQISLSDFSIERCLGPMSLSSKITSSVLLLGDERSKCEPILLMATTKTIFFREMSNDFVKITFPESYQGIKQFYNINNMIFALTNSGHVLEICPITYMLMNTGLDENLSIDNMNILECTDERIEFMILTKEGEDGLRKIRIIDYPSLECHTEVEVTAHSWLIQQVKCSVTLYHLSSEAMSSSNIPNAIVINAISETDPSERFKSLIAKGRFDEAEEFGLTFEFDLQPVHEAKAKRLLLELCNSHQHDFESLNCRFEQFLKLVKNIKSKDFFKYNRQISIPSRSLLKRYLQEVRQRLNEEADEKDVIEVNEHLHRLATLSIIDPYECNMDWQRFVYNPNLVKIITSHFKTDMLTACVIWKRHSSSIMSQTRESDMRQLLKLIPHNTELFAIVQWLRYYVPTAGNIYPQLMPFITEWSLQKIRSLQLSKLWPEIGLELSTKIMEIFEDLQHLHSDLRKQHQCNVAKFRELVNNLRNLHALKINYNLISTLDNYLQDSIDDTALYILQHVHTEKLSSVVNDFLCPLYREKGGSPMTAVRRYISLLVENRHCFSSWLARAVACIQLLHNQDDRMESALLTLQYAPVPWPSLVAPLIKLRFSTHPLAVDISAECEMQPIKLMKVKYGWPTDSTANMRWPLFLSRITKLNLPDMLADIQTLIKAVPSIDTQATIHCSYFLIKEGRLEDAYAFYKLMKAHTDLKIAKRVTDIFVNVLETDIFYDPKCSEEYTTTLIEFCKLLSSEIEDDNARDRLQYTQSRFVLCRDFGVRMPSINNLFSKSGQLQLMDLAIDNIIETCPCEKNAAEYCISQLFYLSSMLRMEKAFGVKRFCERICCLPITCIMAYHLLELVDCTSANGRDFIDLALILLAQQIIAYNKNKNGDVPLSRADSYNNDEPPAFLLAYELMNKAQLPCNDYELFKFISIIVHALPLDTIANYFNSNGDETLNEIFIEKFREMRKGVTVSNGESANMSLMRNKELDHFECIDFQPQSMTKCLRVNQQLIVNILCQMLTLILVMDAPLSIMFNDLKRHLPELKINISDIVMDISHSLEALIKEKMHNVWFVAAQCILQCQKIAKCEIINEQLIFLQLISIIGNALKRKDANFIDLYAMLISVEDPQELLHKIQADLMNDQQKTNFFILWEMFTAFLGERKKLPVLRANRLKYYYSMEFSRQDPSIKGKFNADKDSIKLLPLKTTNPNLDKQLLKNLSIDFDLKYQETLIAHMIGILRAQEMKYDIKINEYHEEELIVFNTMEQIRGLCQSCLNDIQDITLLKTELKKFIKEINFYFYEMYLCVIDILHYLNCLPKRMEVWSGILHFLKHKMIKHRVKRPSPMEIDFWMRTQSDIGVIPKIALFRLPFLPIVEKSSLENILISEINVDNCESWFPLIKMHSALVGADINETNKICDYFCMSAVKNCFAEYKSNSDRDEWHLQPTNNEFLKSIQRITNLLHDPSKAFKILYSTGHYAPEGADKVEALSAAYEYAIARADTMRNNPDVHDDFQKIIRTYPNLKTQHILHVYNLMDEQFMCLITKPMELICRLYLHRSLMKLENININIVATEIATLHHLNIDGIQFQLLKQWLLSPMNIEDSNNLNETQVDDMNMTQNTELNKVNTNAENVIRANHILSSWPKYKVMNFLISHIYPADGKVSTRNQLQMFECFATLNDGNETFNNVFNQQQYIATKCVHELKQFGFKCNVKSFLENDKINILKIIWKRSIQTREGLEILASICLEYNIFLAKIWNGILKNMTAFGMHQQLDALVDILSCKPLLLHLNGLAAAWEYVLKTPFKNANQSQSLEQEEILQKLLCRLQGCPVIQKLNLFEFAEICISLKRPHMAAILIPFTQNKEQRENIKKLIGKQVQKDLYEEILALKSAGILPIVTQTTLNELNL